MVFGYFCYYTITMTIFLVFTHRIMSIWALLAVAVVLSILLLVSMLTTLFYMPGYRIDCPSLYVAVVAAVVVAVGVVVVVVVVAAVAVVVAVVGVVVVAVVGVVVVAAVVVAAVVGVVVVVVAYPARWDHFCQLHTYDTNDFNLQ
jgi:hypothetical protein